MKRIFVLLLFCAIALSASAQYGITMSGALRDGLGRVTNGIPITVDQSGAVKVAGDGVVYYWITNSLTVTNMVDGAPFYGLLTLTNASDGTRCPEIISCMPINRDGYAFDFEIQTFSSPPTNGTYAAGTAITDWGNDRLYLLPALTQTTLTGAQYGYSWRTNAGLAILDAQPIAHAVPIIGTNLQFLIINKTATTNVFTNGITWLIGLKN